MNEEFMAEAISLSINKMQANEGGPFGAVVVRNGEIISRGWNRVTSTNDPTATLRSLPFVRRVKNLAFSGLAIVNYM